MRSLGHCRVHVIELNSDFFVRLDETVLVIKNSDNDGGILSRVSVPTCCNIEIFHGASYVALPSVEGRATIRYLTICACEDRVDLTIFIDPWDDFSGLLVSIRPIEDEVVEVLVISLEGQMQKAVVQFWSQSAYKGIFSDSTCDPHAGDRVGDWVMRHWVELNLPDVNVIARVVPTSRSGRPKQPVFPSGAVQVHMINIGD